MGASVAKRLASTPLNSIEPRPAKASIDVNRQETSGDIQSQADAVSLFFETIAAIGMSDKEAAYYMAMDAAQLSRIKTRQARLPFDAMWRMPDHFWAEFADRIEQARGLSDVAVKRVKAARISELVRLLVEDVA